MILPGIWLQLLKKAADGGRVVYGLMLLEERYPTHGPLREEFLRSLILEARLAARAALVYLGEGGTVPAYLQDLRDLRESRERERGEYRDRACRANLGLLPKDDRGWHVKRALDLLRYVRRTEVLKAVSPRGLPELTVISTLRRLVYRGLDRACADRAYSAAVRDVEVRGEGSVLLMSGSQILERYTAAGPARMSPTGAVKRRINRVMREISVLARQLTDLSGELPAPDPGEVEAMLAGQRPFSYEAFLVGVLTAIQFYLSEATVTLWGEGYSRYKPSTFRGEIHDPQILNGLSNAMSRRTGARRAVCSSTRSER